jgi:glucose/arabinose dehydrogenase
VGFTWHPDTGELWFTDNGRDMLGDDLPPDELNHAPTKGLHFGFPYCHGGEILDAKFGVGRNCDDYVAPARKLGAHVASLGVKFYTGAMFPEEYQGRILIAEHGSWNRSKKAGYRISMLQLEDGQSVSYEVFAEGWLQGQRAEGRPVDLLVIGDGSLLVSDDASGVVYRISYEEPQ